MATRLTHNLKSSFRHGLGGSRGAIPSAAGALSISAAVCAAVATGHASQLASGFDTIDLMSVVPGIGHVGTVLALGYPVLFAAVAGAEHAVPGSRVVRWLSRRTLGSLYLLWSLGLAGLLGLHALELASGMSALLLGALALFIAGSGIVVRNLDRRSERSNQAVARTVASMVTAGVALTPVAIWVATAATPTPLVGLIGWGYAFGAALTALAQVLPRLGSRRDADRVIRRDLVRRALS